MLLAEGFGNAETALALSGAGTVGLGALSYFVKDFIKTAKEAERKAVDLDKRLAILESLGLADRLHAMEGELAEIRGDCKFVRRWIENQSGLNRDRRSTDRHEGGSSS